MPDDSRQKQNGHGQPVRVDIKDAIATVVIERSETLNALTDDVLDGVTQAMARLGENPAVRVAILRGAGQRAFASGMDLKILKTYDPAGTQEHFDKLNEMLYAIERAPFPVIAMVQGYALGGGSELAAACDLRIAGSSARIGVPIGRFGHCPDRVNLRRMMRLISPAHLKAMIMTDTIYDADDAYRMGFFNWVVPDSALEAFTHSIALTVSQKSPLGLKTLKEVMAQVMEGSVEHAQNPDEDAVTALWATRDFQEGIAAFFERRKPDFKGE